MGTAKLYVGNLSFNTTEMSLRTAFESEGGSVLSVTIAVDEATGRPRGFGFVQMGSAVEGQRAIDAWNGRELDGHPILVSDAGDRPSRMEPATTEFRAGGRRRR